MEEMKLLYSDEVILEDDRIMKLEYNLMESFNEQMEPYYGIRITKYLEDATESEEIRGISDSRSKVISMIYKLFTNQVTPISMVEIVDDLITLEE